MIGGFRLGRLFGITIKIDWSWFLIFFLITWNLSVVFGQFHAQWGAGLRWGIALLASVLFFISVLAHELAHSIVAKMQGLPVRSIVLFLFGGVSNLQRQPPSPKAEFLITIVGPLTSFILGILFIMLAVVIPPGLMNVDPVDPMAAIAQLNPVGTLFLWLGWVNILLAIFNLIPGFPLDGGRILRSALWAATDNLRRATRWASWVGQAIAWLLIAAGIAMIFGVQIPFFGTGLIAGIWLTFIGWFLNSASIQSYQQVVIQDILEDVPVRHLMRADPPTVHPDRTVGDLVHNYMMRTDDHAFPVVENGELLGLVTLEDVRKVSRDQWNNILVREIMTPEQELIVANSEEDAAETLNKLMQRDLRQLPVITNSGKLAGLLRRRDIMRWLQLQSGAA